MTQADTELFTKTLAVVTDDSRGTEESIGVHKRALLSGFLGSLHPRLWLPGLVAIGAIGIAWQLVAVHNHYLIPTLGALSTYFFGHLGFLGGDALVTMQEMAVGLSTAFAAAFVLAVLMVHDKPLERAVMPVVVLMNVTPVVAIAPGLTAAFGFGMLPKYIVTALIVFFPILINSIMGLRSVDPQALDLLRTLHASRFEILLRLRLPSSLPFVFAAARVAFPVSLVGAVVAEFSASGQSRGLGSLIQSAAAYDDLPVIYSSIVCLALVGLGVTLLVVVLENKLLSWHTSKRQVR
jgi:NitT/TauT family transport system permease protein